MSRPRLLQLFLRLGDVLTSATRCQSNLEYPCRQCSQVDISLFLVNKDTAMWARDAFFDANTIRIEALKQRAGSLEHCEQEMRSVELAFGVAAKMMLEIDTDDTELVRYKSLPRLRRLRLVVMEHTFDIVGKGREMGRADILAWMAEIGLFGMKAKKA